MRQRHVLAAGDAREHVLHLRDALIPPILRPHKGEVACGGVSIVPSRTHICALCPHLQDQDKPKEAAPGAGGRKDLGGCSGSNGSNVQEKGSGSPVSRTYNVTPQDLCSRERKDQIGTSGQVPMNLRRRSHRRKRSGGIGRQHALRYVLTIGLVQWYLT